MVDDLLRDDLWIKLNKLLEKSSQYDDSGLDLKFSLPSSFGGKPLARLKLVKSSFAVVFRQIIFDSHKEIFTRLNDEKVIHAKVKYFQEHHDLALNVDLLREYYLFMQSHLIRQLEQQMFEYLERNFEQMFAQTVMDWYPTEAGLFAIGDVQDWDHPAFESQTPVKTYPPLKSRMNELLFEQFNREVCTRLGINDSGMASPRPHYTQIVLVEAIVPMFRCYLAIIKKIKRLRHDEVHDDLEQKLFDCIMAEREPSHASCLALIKINQLNYTSPRSLYENIILPAMKQEQELVGLFRERYSLT